jgi:diguanylate cyclase (GGDEF)-like protein/PAS domain S-box-containing protein
MTPKKILVVEDESVVAMDIQDRLEALGYDVVATAATGKRAIEKGETLRPDLVLMDIQLQGEMDGVYAAGEIRRRFDVPVIFLTANADDGTIQRAKVTEPFGYIIKPFEERELHIAIEMALYKHQADRKMKESEERYRILVELSPEAIALQSGDKLIYINPAGARLLGAESPAELLSRPLTDFVHPDFIGNFRARELCLKETQQSDLKEEKFVRADGQVMDVEVVMAAVTYQGMPAIQTIIRDITARKRAEKQLLHDALHDSLTKLPNRVSFMDHLKLAVNHTKRRKNYLFALLFVDLDRFKVVNDSLGHAVGDELLLALSVRLGTCLRAGDTLARLGGDEFTILLDAIDDHESAKRVAERIQEVLSHPFKLAGHEMSMSASIGIAFSDCGENTAEELLRDADTAMYRAKSLGKARYQIFDKDMHTHAVTLLKLESDLRGAIEREELRVHYQPTVSLESGRITGFEALVRWQHPQRGLIPPIDFLPNAEDTGMIIEIDRWVLREACRQMRQWHEQLPSTRAMKINVNLSCKQFMQTDLVDYVAKILSETGLAPESLRLEITETVVMADSDRAMKILEELKGLGVEMSLDDFGTGYSSLSYIHRFPVATLKIDRSFIDRVGGEENGEIVRTVVAMARNLGMEVIAEGVETMEQLIQLKAISCDQAQGFHFSKAVTADAAAILLRKEMQGLFLGVEEHVIAA